MHEGGEEHSGGCVKVRSKGKGILCGWNVEARGMGEQKEDEKVSGGWGTVPG